ncbi:putative aldouronate transport system substrate-binding protein [Anaerotaenia torta]|uniref:extracellular solute-binding protein n=1 Tax=Anaerotaenia torta TaxID=433293 RepID=UPI003D1F494D
MKKRMVRFMMCVAGMIFFVTGCKSNEVPSRNIKEFTAFFDVEGSEINDDNTVQDIIGDKIGAKCKEVWLSGQSSQEAIGIMIASGEYPDFLNWSPRLQDAGAFIPIDAYWEAYPNIRNFWSDIQWESVRQGDGHIYSIPQFGNINIKTMDTQQSSEAFWIQTRVLKWAGYPVIETLDQLFELLGNYYAANPVMPDGSPVIPFGILAYDWYYFCMENPPQFLDGYPNNGSVIVEKETAGVKDYNISETAQRYFRKLNEQYKKGIVDPEFMTMHHDQFLEKIASGRMLCMVEQYWDFGGAEEAIRAQGLEGCTYVPLGITIDPGMHEMYYTSNEAATFSGGLSISVDCEDIEGALQFINDLLSQEIMTLRNWGVEGKDYLADGEGLYYRTEEMRRNAVNPEYKASNLCSYSYFPNYIGMNLDGKNAATPNTQPSEFFAGLAPEVQECLEAYGARTYIDMLDYNVIDPEEEPWYPMWTHSNTLTTQTAGGMAWIRMAEVKHNYLPQVIISQDFDSIWEEYMQAYERCRPEDFLAEMQEEVYRRIELVTGKNIRP